jgi:uncharacterized membrane protein
MLTYDLMLLGHILGSTTLVGGTLLLQVLAMRATRPRAPRGELVALARQAAWVGPRVFLPASAVILATGAGLASQLQVGVDEPFVVIGLVVLLAASATGPAFLAPESRRISHMLAAEGPASSEVERRVRRIFLVSRMELLLLLVALTGMVLRPTL